MSVAPSFPSEPAGSESAEVLIERLYAEHFRLVRGLCRRVLRDPVEADDAAQQTFLSAYKSLIGGTRPEQPSAWLATIARHECWARTQARMREPLAVDEPEGSAPDAFSEAARTEDAAALRDALGELPPAQKEAFVLRELAGLSQREASTALAISESALEALLVRARRRLRQRLEPVLQPLYGLGALPLALRQLLAQLGASGGAAASFPMATKIAAATMGVALLATGVGSDRSESARAQEPAALRALAEPGREVAPVVAPETSPIASEAPTREATADTDVPKSTGGRASSSPPAAEGGTPTSAADADSSGAAEATGEGSGGDAPTPAPGDASDDTGEPAEDDGTRAGGDDDGEESRAGDGGASGPESDGDDDEGSGGSEGEGDGDNPGGGEGIGEGGYESGEPETPAGGDGESSEDSGDGESGSGDEGDSDPSAPDLREQAEHDSPES